MELLNPQSVTVWCTVMCDRIIGPYFFENAEGFTETVNGERYRHMLNTFLSYSSAQSSQAVVLAG